MEPPILGVVLDSSVVIEAERQRLDVAHFLKYIATRIGEREAALCSITWPNSRTVSIALTHPSAAKPAAPFWMI